MKTWQAILAALALIGSAFGGFFVLDGRYFHVDVAASEKEALQLQIAQTASALQSGINANQLQLMIWELNDINARIAAGKALPGDAARKLVLEERIRKLSGK